MSISLVKGQGVNLNKKTPDLKEVLIGLRWKAMTRLGYDLEIDASIVMLDVVKTSEEKYRNIKRDVVWYNHKIGLNNSVLYKGPELNNDDGYDDQLTVSLDKVPKNVKKLAIIINIFNAHKKQQDLSQVSDLSVRVENVDTNKELVRYNVIGNYSNMTGMLVAELYRYKSGWRFKAIGKGSKAKNIGNMVKLLCRK